jgi:hypothetical protein
MASQHYPRLPTGAPHASPATGNSRSYSEEMELLNAANEGKRLAFEEAKLRRDMMLMEREARQEAKR